MNTKILSYFAFASVVATLVGIAVNGLELALFAVAASALLLLIAATDYAPRRSYRRVPCAAGVRCERLPFAG